MLGDGRVVRSKDVNFDEGNPHLTTGGDGNGDVDDVSDQQNANLLKPTATPMEKPREPMVTPVETTTGNADVEPQCYNFNTLAPKQALTLSDITLSFLPLLTITLSYLSIYFCSYIFLSSRSSPISPYVTLSLHFILDHSASDNLSRRHAIRIAYPSSIPTLSSLPTTPL